jgi:hypothetical protein
MSKRILFAAIRARNKAFSKLSTDPANAPKQEHLRKTRNTVKCIVKLAKAKNQVQFVNNTLAKRQAKNPKKGWDTVRALSTRCYHHYAQPPAMKMKLLNGNLAEDNKENADIDDILGILKRIRKKTTMSNLKNMANRKAPGESKIPAKSLTQNPCQIIQSPFK